MRPDACAGSCEARAVTESGGRVERAPTAAALAIRRAEVLIGDGRPPAPLAMPAMKASVSGSPQPVHRDRAGRSRPKRGSGIDNAPAWWFSGQASEPRSSGQRCLHEPRVHDEVERPFNRWRGGFSYEKSQAISEELAAGCALYDHPCWVRCGVSHSQGPHTAAPPAATIQQ